MVTLEEMKITFLTLPLGNSIRDRGILSHSPKTYPALVIFTFVLACMLFYGQPVFGAASAGVSRASAVGVSGVSAQLNGARLDRGATLFGADVVTLGVDSSAALQF